MQLNQIGWSRKIHPCSIFLKAKISSEAARKTEGIETVESLHLHTSSRKDVSYCKNCVAWSNFFSKHCGFTHMGDIQSTQKQSVYHLLKSGARKSKSSERSKTRQGFRFQRHPPRISHSYCKICKRMAGSHLQWHSTNWRYFLLLSCHS